MFLFLLIILVKLIFNFLVDLSKLKNLSPLYSYWHSDQNDLDERNRLLIANKDSPALYLFEKEPYKWEILFQSIIREIINGDLSALKGLQVLLSSLSLEVRKKVLKDLLLNKIINQNSFVQLNIYRDDEELVLETNGLKLNKFTELVRDKWDGSTQKDFHKFETRCSMDIDWDDEGSTSNELTVQQIRVDETKVLMGIANDESNKNDPIPDTGSKICFSKDGTYYSVSDKFYETSSAGFNLKENLYICQNALPDDSEEELGTYCQKEGETKPIQANFFRVNWSRFGSINLYKWANDWVTQ